MRLYKEHYTDKDGKQRKTQKWYVDFSDHHNRRHRIPGFTEKRSTQALADNIEALVSCKMAGQQPGVELQKWLEVVPTTLLKKLVSWDILDGQRAEGGKLLSVHLEDWKKSLLANGCDVRHAKLKYKRVQRVFAKCGFKTWAGVSASRLQHEISILKKEVHRKVKGEVIAVETEPATVKTKNYYLQACQQFCRWAVMDGRIVTNPLLHLKPSKAESEKRAAIEPVELSRLLRATEASPECFRIPGHERALLYRFAAQSGLRANEIRCLTAASFDLDNQLVTLAGKYTKNGQDTTLPLRKDTVAMLKELFVNKLPQTNAFRLPSKYNMADMLRADLAAAQIEIDPERGQVCFHSLRHSFGTMLAASGVHPKTAQTLMRHSDINLTMSRYSHVLRGQEATAVESLPDLNCEAHKSKKATGTND